MPDQGHMPRKLWAFHDTIADSKDLQVHSPVYYNALKNASVSTVTEVGVTASVKDFLRMSEQAILSQYGDEA